FHEAELLDQGRYTEWLKLLDGNIYYRLVAPILASTNAVVVLMDERLSSLQARVTQLSTPNYGIAESPASFTRRFVSNVTVEPDKDGTLSVHASVLVYRSRGGTMTPHLYSMGRTDRLISAAGSLKL